MLYKLLVGIVLIFITTNMTHKAEALQSLTTPEGVTINVYVDTVSVHQVYDWLKAAGLQANVGLTRVDVVDEGLDVASVGGSCYDNICWANASAIQINDDSLLAHPYATLGHEYGHVWSYYYRWTLWQGSWDSYLIARGILGDSRLNSSYCWRPEELIANDYQRLLAAPETTPGVYVSWCPSDLPNPNQVPGLKDFLSYTWTNSNVPPTPTPTPTLTPTPTISATPTPITTPHIPKGKKPTPKPRK